QPGNTPQSVKESSGDRSFATSGPLRLEHNAGSGNLLDRVLLGDLQLGRFTPVVQESGTQSLWVSPDRVEQVESYTGPVRTLFLLTAALSAPEKGAIKTAVDTQGTYSRQEERARRYRIRFQISQFAGESWFGTRFLGAENTDTLPWGFRSYYHYPVSCIGGRAEDDQAENTGSYPCWKDTAAGAVYGAVVDTTRMRVNFWKDTPEGAGEHPDIWREMNQELRPGQKLPAASDEPEVLLYGARISPDNAGNETLNRLRALSAIQTQLK
ncbi:MAG TPA: hypothetical protein VHR86_04580, partial [Armatimonadota bacterium]|nr:hypothetical protein [Armatimonadota bacterium]